MTSGSLQSTSVRSARCRSRHHLMHPTDESRDMTSGVVPGRSPLGKTWSTTTRSDQIGIMFILAVTCCFAVILGFAFTFHRTTITARYNAGPWTEATLTGYRRGHKGNGFIGDIVFVRKERSGWTPCRSKIDIGLPEHQIFIGMTIRIVPRERSCAEVAGPWSR